MEPMGPSGGLIRRMRWGLLALVCHAAFAANPQAEQLIMQGDAQVKALHATEALALFEQAAKADPNDVEILLRISQQCSNLIAQAKTPAEAQAYAKRSLEEAQKAVALAPANAKAHLALAVAYGRLTDFEDNRTKVEFSRYIKNETDKTLELDPKEDFAWHVLGRWTYNMADISGIKRTLAEAIYGKMPTAKFEEAARCFEKAIALNPSRPMHYIELGRTYADMGRTAEARKVILKGLAMPPTEKDDPETKDRGRQILASLR